MFFILITQPIVTGIILVLLFNFDPIFVYITALLTQIIYYRSVPSGASFYPEFSFSFFMTTGVIANKIGLIRNNTINNQSSSVLFSHEKGILNYLIESDLYFYIIITLFLIIFFSYIFARFYSIKIKIIEKLIENKNNKNIETGKIDNLSYVKLGFISTIISILIGTISSLIIFVVTSFLFNYLFL